MAHGGRLNPAATSQPAVLMFLLDPRLPIQAEVQRVSLEELSSSLSELADPQLAPDAVVHSVRKRLKRLRAVVRLVRGELGPAFGLSNRTFRDAGRRLSALRDSRVASDTLLRLEDLNRPELSRKVQDHLAGVRESLLGQSSRGSRKKRYAVVRTEVISDLEPALSWPAAWRLERTGFSAVEAGLSRTYREGRSAMMKARANGDAQAFHEWRKRVKDHWHHTQLVGSHLVLGLRDRAEKLHGLSESLGQLQDLQVLESATGELEMNSATGTLLGSLVAEERARLQAVALRAGGSLYRYRAETVVRRFASSWMAAGDPAV